jgi:transposase
MQTHLGIDIAKRKFDVALLRQGKYRTHVFDNTPAGFEQLIEWLMCLDAGDTHGCMEATGGYGLELATLLHDRGITISVVNPAQIKGFALSELSRIKTDKADAKLIARFCQSHNPPSWQPPPPSIRQLQVLARRLDALIEMRRMETNRLETAHSLIVPSIQEMITQLDRQIALMRQAIREHIDSDPDLRCKRDLLESIPGIGETTVTQILTFLVGAQFTRAKQVAAFLGLNPQQHDSGSSIRHKARMSKTGDSRLRVAFYMPAIVAMRYNPVIKAFSERLQAAGKPKMLVVGASMRKLAHIAFGVLKSGRPFDPTVAPC